MKKTTLLLITLSLVLACEKEDVAETNNPLIGEWVQSGEYYTCETYTYVDDYHYSSECDLKSIISFSSNSVHIKSYSNYGDPCVFEGESFASYSIRKESDNIYVITLSNARSIDRRTNETTFNNNSQETKYRFLESNNKFEVFGGNPKETTLDDKTEMCNEISIYKKL